MGERDPHPFETPSSEGVDSAASPEPSPKLQLTLVLIGVIISFGAELLITAGAAALYIAAIYSELSAQPELIFWQVTGSPFLRMVSALSGLPSTMLGGYVTARKVTSRPRAHAVLVAILYAGMLTAVAELVITRDADTSSDYVAYASTLSGVIVGGLLGGLFAARGRRG